MKQYAREQRSIDDWSVIEETRIHHGSYFIVFYSVHSVWHQTPF